MAPPTKTLFVEGNTADLAFSLAEFIAKVSQDGKILETVEPLAENKLDEAVQALVDASVALNSASEDGEYF